MSPSRKPQKGGAHGDPVQRAIAALSVLLVLGTIAFLAWQILFEAKTPPHIIVELVDIDARSAPGSVTFRARNTGTRAAAAVQIEGVIQVGDAIVERASATLDYVPGGASRAGGLFFHTPFTREQLRVRALGYVDP